MAIEQLEQVAKKGWNPAPVLQIIQKISEKYRLTKFGGLMSCGSKDMLKNVPCLTY